MGVLHVVYVFGEEFRFDELSDVVKICANAGEEGVGPDIIGGGLRQLCDDHAVMIRARGLDRQALEQRVPEVGKLQEADVRGDVEDELE